MKWNKKFNYPKSTRKAINGKRYYSIMDEQLPSVTSILSQTMPDSKREGLKNWRENIGKVKSEKITRESAIRGTAVHKYVEDFLRNRQNLSLLGDNSKEKQMADEIIENGIKNSLSEIWGCEETLFFPKKFAGAADIIAGDYEGKSAILDIKSCSKPRQHSWNSEWYTQISAYILAHNKVYDTLIDKAVVLSCTKDLFFQKFSIEGEELKKYQDLFLNRLNEFYLKN